MKNTTERTLFHRLLWSCIPLLFLFVGTACQKDAEEDPTAEMTGTWHQTSRTIDGIDVAKDSTRPIMQINENQNCQHF